MTVVTTAMGLPGIPFPQHLLGKANTVQSYRYPGSVQVKSTGPTRTSYTMGLPSIPFAQHLSGKANTVQSFMFPGAVQPLVPSVVSVIVVGGGYDAVVRNVKSVAW